MTRLLHLALALCIAPALHAQDTPNPKVIRVSGGVMAGMLLPHANPAYPQEARDKGIQGAVILRAIIGKDGNITNLQVIGGNEILAKSAWDTIKDWTYKPYLRNGEPTEVDTTITCNFALDTTPKAQTINPEK